MSITINSTSQVELTPRLMAEAFWGMDSKQQADFFHELHSIVSASTKTNYSLGEMQWCYMAGDTKERSAEAWNMYLSLSSFAFELWPRKSEVYA